MKNILAILVVIMFVAAIGYSQSASTISKGFPMIIQDAGITGFVSVSSKSLLDVSTLVGTLPAGTTAIWLTSASGAFVYGDSALASPTVANYPEVADGAHVRIPIFPGTKNPVIYLLNSTGAATSTVKVMAEVQR